jgi:hypothetical protein
MTDTPRPRGRPPTDTPRDVKVRVFLTREEVAELDRRRGDTSRSGWLARPLRP